MAEIQVLITRPVEKEFVEQITAVDSRIQLLDAAAFSAAEDKGDFSDREKFDALLEQAEIICGYWPPISIMTRAPRLKWFHAMIAGVDRPDFAEMLRSPVVVSNSTGIHNTQVSELVLMLMLNLAKKAPFFFKQQQEKRWSPAIPGVLEGKTLGILGFGNIGRAVARLAKAFGMRVIATRRSITEATCEPDVDRLLPASSLPELLAESDFVVIALPATPATGKLIGEAELRMMKPSAFIINIARGKIINEGALTRAIKENWIAGAGLDTVAVEPLPSWSELWELPNVIITPHVGGRRTDYNRLAIPLFLENLKRYLGGEPLLNLIDKAKGY
ncbi:MAG: D-2-hydroxyacid dehydrogenase [Deltaproteobacteria bacterium]|nr:D-2-hydroxyacid dehydrogenase [Deltaproteobacteria bacterium]